MNKSKKKVQIGTSTVFKEKETTNRPANGKPNMSIKPRQLSRKSTV